MNASIAGEGVARLKNLHSGNSILMDKQNLFTFLCIRFLIIVLLSGFCIEYCYGAGGFDIDVGCE